MLVDQSELLLHDRLAPITTSMGFLNAGLVDAAKELEFWLKDIKEPQGIVIKRREIHDSLEEIFKVLVPLSTMMSRKRLLIATTSNWTCYLDNRYRGTDPSAISVLARRLKCQTLWMIAKPHTYNKEGKRRSGRQGALLLEVFGPEDTDWQNIVRSIRLVNNAGSWEFELTGTPFPFEKTERYEARKKTDRFTFEMLKDYLDHLGLQPFDEYYYLPEGKGNAILLDHTGTANDVKHVSLEEARRMNGIED